MSDKVSKNRTIFILLALAAGTIYFVAYARNAFYTQMQDALNLTNSQIGELASIFGIVALVSYMPSGIVADKYKMKNLFLISFLSTGILTLWHATFPSFNTLRIIYIGLALANTIPFWSVYVKGVRLLFDESSQGKGFGMNESLRWIFNTLFALIGLQFLNFIPDSVQAYRMVLIFSGIFYIILGFVLYLYIPNDFGMGLEYSKEVITENKTNKKEKLVLKALKLPGLWILTLIIFSAYIYMQVNTYLTPYFVDIVGLSESTAATLAIVRSYLLAAIAALITGVISDKFSSRVKVCLGLFIIGGILFTGMLIIDVSAIPLILTILMVCVITFIIYAFRGIYWAIQGELQIPLELSGTVIGIVSILAYSPDAFFPKIAGEILDRYPGVQGYNILFSSVVVASIVGIIASLIAIKYVNKHRLESKSIKIFDEE